VKKTSQDLYRLHKPVVEARESPKLSLITAEFYGDHVKSREEEGLLPNVESSDNSDDEAPSSQSHEVHSEDLAALLG
jgi:hypothetical protein